MRTYTPDRSFRRLIAVPLSRVAFGPLSWLYLMNSWSVIDGNHPYTPIPWAHAAYLSGSALCMILSSLAALSGGILIYHHLEDRISGFLGNIARIFDTMLFCIWILVTAAAPFIGWYFLSGAPMPPAPQAIMLFLSAAIFVSPILIWQLE